MEHMNTPQEIVLTCRQEPREVVLDLRRPLPRHLQRVEEDALFDPPTYVGGGRRRLLWGLALLAALIAVGVGMWFWQQRSAPVPEDPPAWEDRAPHLPEIDGYEIVTEEPKQTTIDTYRPYGASATHLELHTAPEETLLWV